MLFTNVDGIKMMEERKLRLFGEREMRSKSSSKNFIGSEILIEFFFASL
jgi:hypothetical protein